MENTIGKKVTAEIFANVKKGNSALLKMEKSKQAFCLCEPLPKPKGGGLTMNTKANKERVTALDIACWRDDAENYYEPEELANITDAQVVDIIIFNRAMDGR